MKVFHFYPRTANIGDHFVRDGIVRLFREIVPAASFTSFDVNATGQSTENYGLTRSTVARANAEADVVVVGGSNLYEPYEGQDRWGIHLEPGALEALRPPLILLGIGTGSEFMRPLPRPSAMVAEQIRTINRHAALSGVRDALTLDWLANLGVTTARLLGDPATFLFNRAVGRRGGYVLVAPPPHRFLNHGRRRRLTEWRPYGLFRATRAAVRALEGRGHRVVVACNQPGDLAVARRLLSDCRAEVNLPESAEAYFELLRGARAVVSGRLHTAVVALSLGTPFGLVDVDQRTHGFVVTYQPGRWTIRPRLLGMSRALTELALAVAETDDLSDWERMARLRDDLHQRCESALRETLTGLGLLASTAAAGGTQR